MINDPQPGHRRSLFSGLLAVSPAVLLLELSLTRQALSVEKEFLSHRIARSRAISRLQIYGSGRTVKSMPPLGPGLKVTRYRAGWPHRSIVQRSTAV